MNRFQEIEDDSEDDLQDMPNRIDNLFDNDDLDDEYDDLLQPETVPVKQVVKPVLKAPKGQSLPPDEIAIKERELREHQMRFRPQTLIERVKKLSNMGFSEHDRILQLTPQGISYYNRIPKELEGTGVIQLKELKMLKMQPKYSVSIACVIQCEEIDQKERAKFKKFYKDGTHVFKLVFDQRGLTKGGFSTLFQKSLNMPIVDSADSDDDIEPGTPPQLPFKNLVGNKTWFFNCGSDSKMFGAHPREWIKHVTLRAQAYNPAYFKVCDTFTQINDEHRKQSDAIFAQIQTLKQLKIQTQQAMQRRDTKAAQEAKKQVNILEPFKNQQKSGNSSTDQKPKREIEDIEEHIKLLVNINPMDALKQNKGMAGENAKVAANQNFNLLSASASMTEERKDEVKKIIDAYNSRQLNMKQNRESIEQLGWDMKYQNQFEYLVQSVNDQKRHLKISESFIDHIGKFRATATSIVKMIVDELHLPDNERKIKPVGQQAAIEKFALFYDDENTKPMIFYDEKLTKNIIIKLTHEGDVCHEVSANLPVSKESIQTSFQDHSSFSGNMQGHPAKVDRYWRKQFGREHLSNDVIFDAIFLNSKPKESFRLRVPLTALIDYKGFRAMAIAKIQVSQLSQPELGFSDGIYMTQDERLKDELGFIGEVLNLRDNRITLGTNSFNKETIPVSSFIRVYKHQVLENSMDKEAWQDSPTARRWFDFHYGELDYNQHPKFILNTAEIFPLDLEIYPNRDRVLRPEFLCSYEIALKADTKRSMPSYVQSSKQLNNFSKSRVNPLGDPNYSAFDQNDKKDELEQKDLANLNEAARFLRQNTIAQLIDYLDNLVIVPIDSSSLMQAFHVSGINMRYLGWVALKAELPHVKDICITEMVARTLKRLFNTQISGLVLNNQDKIKQVQKLINQINSQMHDLEHKPMNHIILSQSDMSRKRNFTTEQAKAKLQAEKEDLNRELLELNQDMDDNMQMWTLDFMNLVFSRGTEHDEFFNEVVYPEAYNYYDFKVEHFKKHSLRLNALYYALIELIGIKVLSIEQRLADQEKPKEKTKGQIQQKERKQSKGYANSDEENFFKNFGKEERPFGNFEPKPRYYFELLPKSKTFSLRNLPYTILASKFKEYNDNSYINDAIESCRMRTHIRRHLVNDEADTETQADLCQIYLDRKQWGLAQKFARKALKKTPPLHARQIRFYCILMQAFYMDDKVSEADICFTKALQILEHHWGPFHPIHINIYSIMAQLLIHKGKHDDAGYLFKASLLCCMRIMGPNHIQTGDVHMDFGKLFLFKNKKAESLQHFLEAYLIFDSYFGQNALQTAQAAINVAAILEEEGKLKEAFTYAKVAASTFQNVFSVENPVTIQALWQQLSISYALREPDTVKRAAALLNALTKRDLIIESSLSVDKKATAKGKTFRAINERTSGMEKKEDLSTQEQALSESMEQIKILAVATAIIEVTRTLPAKTKKYLKRFCDKTLFRKKLEESKERNEQMFPSLIDYHLKNIDPMKIAQVKTLKFLPSHSAQLMAWHQMQLSQLTLEDFEENQALRNADVSTRFSSQKLADIEIESPFIKFYQQKIDDVKLMEEQEEIKVQKYVEMGAGVSGLLHLNENEEKQHGFNPETNTIFGNADMSHKGIGIFGTYQEETGEFKYDQFFLKLIQTFDNINFYNLLIL